MILSNPFNQEQFNGFIKEFLPDFQKNEQNVETGKSGFEKIVKLGESDSLLTSVFVFRGTKNIGSRVALTNSSFKVLKNYSIYRALIVYLNQDDTIWRLSLLTATPSFDQSGKIVVTYSNPRRHSYILGTDIGVATARKYLYTKGKVSDFEDLQNRFSVEAVNKDFYAEIAEHFYNLVGKYGSKGEILKKPILKFNDKKMTVETLQNYSVRLIGRIIFLWFLRQKKSSNGHSLLPKELLDFKNRSALHDSLEPLFFEVLNKPQESRSGTHANSPYSDVPYLNGGLFHPSEGPSGDHYSSTSKRSNIEIPNDWFTELYATLNTYNFTIDENLEYDIDLSIDPEMLGRVFENLLAEINPETGQVARKSTGSYYTPRPIVNFMVDESLKNYLIAKTKISDDKINAVISMNRQDDLEYPLSSEEKIQIVSALNTLKVLDPACGSGAFPIGMLQKILWVLIQVDPKGALYLRDLDSDEMFGGAVNRLDYFRKRKIIRDVIFGCDIQPVAVEIAKLRCFLTLIVDQEIDDELPNRGVVPLPNLDFKFICADSLTPLYQANQQGLGDDPKLEEKLSSLRAKYFSTTNEKRKLQLRAEYKEIVDSSPTLFGESKRSAQLKTFNPFAADSKAYFFDAMTMFGFQKFDIAIGNPPYISALAAKKILATELRENYKRVYQSAKGAYDMYLLFMEMGLNNLKDEGTLVYITPTKFLSAKYAESFRQMAHKHIKKIVDFGNSRVFKSAGVSTAISVFRMNVPIDIVLGDVCDVDLYKPVYSRVLPKLSLNEFPEQTWGHLKWGDYNLLSKIYMNSCRLEERSIVVASSTASEADNWAKSVNEVKSQESFKMINTGTIKQFFSTWGITPYSNKKIKILKPYLDISQIELRRVEMFEKPKLIIGKLSKTLKAVLDSGGEYASSNTVFVFDVNKPYSIYSLSAILNSQLMAYIYSSTFSGLNMLGSFQYQAPQIRILPIPKHPNIEILEEIESLVRKLENNHMNSMDSRLTSLDKLVFDLYNLSEGDVKTIESSMQKTHSEGELLDFELEESE